MVIAMLINMWYTNWFWGTVLHACSNQTFRVLEHFNVTKCDKQTLGRASAVKVLFFNMHLRLRSSNYSQEVIMVIHFGRNTPKDQGKPWRLSHAAGAPEKWPKTWPFTTMFGRIGLQFCLKSIALVQTYTTLRDPTGPYGSKHLLPRASPDPSGGRRKKLRCSVTAMGSSGRSVVDWDF